MMTTLVGLNKGHLTVFRDCGYWFTDRGVQPVVMCDCLCGGTKLTTLADMRQGRGMSCGCLRIETTINHSTKHGHSRRGRHSHIYISWRGMTERCSNPRHKDYSNYGGRGISVCDRWKTFSNFNADMGSAWKDGLTLERIDPNQNYSPDNCKWATREEQSFNKRGTNRYSLNGQTLNLKQLASLSGLKSGTLYRRIETFGWPVDVAVAAPLRGHYTK